MTIEDTVSDSDMAKSCSVVEVNDDTAAAWDNFVQSQSGGTFYHLYGWKAVNRNALGHESRYLAATGPGGEIEGILPLVHVRSRLFGHILCSIPFMNFGGPIATSPEVSVLLVNHATKLAEEAKSDYLELRCASPVATSMQASLRKISMTVALPSDPEILWMSFSRKHRKNIRRAQKNCLEVHSGGLELLPDFYRVMERSWRSLGTPLYSINYFREILERFPGSIRIFVCDLKGTPIATALNGQLNGTVEGMWAGVDPKFSTAQPNYALYWEMLRTACMSGYARFHLGRSTAGSGAQDFKSKWMAEARQLYWYVHCSRGGPVRNLTADNPKYRLARDIWRWLPLPITRAIGHRIARGIP